MEFDEISELQKIDTIMDAALRTKFEHQHIVSNRANIAHNENIIYQRGIWVDHIHDMHCSEADKQRFVFRMENPGAITDGYAKALNLSPECHFFAQIDDHLWWHIALNEEPNTHIIMLTEEDEDIDYGMIVFSVENAPNVAGAITGKRYMNLYNVISTNGATLLCLTIHSRSYDLSAVQWKIMPRYIPALDFTPRFLNIGLIDKLTSELDRFIPNQIWTGDDAELNLNATRENNAWKIAYTTANRNNYREYTFIITSKLLIPPKSIRFHISENYVAIGLAGSNPKQYMPESIIDIILDYIIELGVFTHGGFVAAIAA